MTDLRELEKAATPAPWTNSKNTHRNVFTRDERGNVAEFVASCTTTEDSLFIAAMRNALPYLLDVVDAADRVRSDIRAGYEVGIGATGQLNRALNALDEHLGGDK